MGLGTAICRAARIALAVLAVASAPGAALAEQEVSGKLSLETRWFPRSAEFDGQRNYNAGLVAEPQLYVKGAENFSVTVAPFLRVDAADRTWTHADLREAYALLNGPLGEAEWELRLGVDRVFWGVAETRNLVDIVNQTDLIETPNEKVKLCQPMAHLTLSGAWGAAEFFVMSFHRLRTFPGTAGRLRPQLRIDNGRATYESPAGEWHLDFAARYSNAFGPLDLGLSVFDGTSREPVMRLIFRHVQGQLPVPVALAPHYDQIRQFGLDAQLTIESWLLKLEAIYRQGARNNVRNPVDPADLGKKENYAAFVVGGEYTFSGIFESDADLSLLAEWLIDGRRHRATNQYQNDLFFGVRLSLNDVESTAFTLGALYDLDYGTRTMSLEFDRQLTDSVSVKAEAILMLHVDEADVVVHPTRRDSFVGVKLAYSF
ncbi:MAG: hypothetical protein F4204_16760 [Rhodospirillaceae bacterium]|nr:hypothetical protein [Rhodospirillaceae bacterium]